MIKLAWCVAALGFSVIVCMAWLQILSRFVGGGFAWITDATNLIYFWVIWPAIYLATVRKEHFVIDFLGPLLSPGLRRWHQSSIAAIALVYNAVLIVWGIQSAINAMRNHLVFLPSISVFWELLAIPVVAVLLFTYAFSQILRAWDAGDKA